MWIRPYNASDWETVRDIYDLSKPDEMRGGVDPGAIVPLQQDPSALALFRDSMIYVADAGERVIGFAGHQNNYISWLFVHPAHRRQGAARALLSAIMGRLDGAVTLNVAPWNLAARQLYEEFGFAPAREFIGTFNGYDVTVLTLVYDPAS
jgi:ribosomal protein S18 acetylase RimI-like enzyme